MKKIMLKNTELSVSDICYGTGNFGEKLDQEQAFEALDAFVEAGGNFIDTANCYCRWVPGNANSSEQFIGAWLKERNAYNKVVIATKGCHYDFNDPLKKSRVNKKCLQEDIEESLRTLGISVIDFYWMHRDDESRPIGEIIDMLEEMKQQGKIRYYGASNYKLYRIKEAVRYAKEKGIIGFSALSNQLSFATVNEGCNVNQDPSLVMVDHDYYEFHKETGMPNVCFSSTAYGFFEKLYQGGVVAKDGQLVTPEEDIPLGDEMKRAYLNERNLRAYEDMLKIHEETGISMIGLSVAALLNQPFQAFPVASVSRLSQLSGILEASGMSLPDRFIEEYGF